MIMAGVILGAGVSMAQAPKAELPLKLYGDCEDEFDPPYIPSGWMGNVDAIERDDCWPTSPHSGQSCIKITYNDTGKWGGIVWQSPADDWGDEPGGFDLTGAKKLTFWARGEKGGEMVEVKMGILGRNKDFPDSGKASLGRVKLSNAWQKYELPLEGKDLSCIKTGFVWSLGGKKEPITFYLDDIQYE
jgi:hypothetical protein